VRSCVGAGVTVAIGSPRGVFPSGRCPMALMYNDLRSYSAHPSESRFDQCLGSTLVPRRFILRIEPMSPEHGSCLI
jgi:hypothetical protein